MTDNPARGRFNAWMLNALDAYMHTKYGPLKARLLSTVPRTIVELGPGAGANLRYYPAGTEVIAVEPNVRMHERLRRRAAQYDLDLRLRTFGAETMDIDSASVDFVCATLVLCSVDDPAAVVREVRRVLRPGGRFVCIEHVAAPRSSPIGSLQRVLRTPWRWLFEGCDLRNETKGVLRGAGFRQVDIEDFKVPGVFLPVRYHITATCAA